MFLACILSRKKKQVRNQEIINFFWFPCNTPTYDFTQEGLGVMREADRPFRLR